MLFLLKLNHLNTFMLELSGEHDGAYICNEDNIVVERIERIQFGIGSYLMGMT